MARTPQLASSAAEPLKLSDGRLVFPGGRIVDPRSTTGSRRYESDVRAENSIVAPAYVPSELTSSGGPRMNDGVALPATPNVPPGMIEIPTNRDAQRMVAQTRRRIADLPDVPKAMNAISAVLSYTLFGLDDSEIALAIGVTEQQVGNIKMTDAYASMHSTLVSSIMESEMQDVRDLFKQHSRTAANVLVDGLHNGARSDRMMAAKEFLDRAGHRAVDVVEHRMRVEGGLVIEVIKRDDTVKPLVLDLSVDDSDIAQLVKPATRVGTDDDSES